ncbi:MAG: transcriptional repressor [Thermodesulfobacteriota bacterium]
MKQIHSHERDQFEKLFRQEQIDHLEDRLRVLDAFLQTEQHVTAEELKSILDEHGHDMGVEFVTETLELMCRFGFAQHNRFHNGAKRYEHRHLGHHHDHLVCTKCGRIMEFENQKLEALQQQIAADYGFMMLQHSMEIYGICDACQADRKREIPLVVAKPGERTVIKELIGGSSSRLRLMSMGLRVGDEVEILTNTGKGQLVVAADHQRFVLGRGLAQKIIVASVDAGASGQAVTPKS